MNMTKVNILEEIQNDFLVQGAFNNSKSSLKDKLLAIVEYGMRCHPGEQEFTYDMRILMTVLNVDLVSLCKEYTDLARTTCANKNDTTSRMDIINIFSKISFDRDSLLVTFKVNSEYYSYFNTYMNDVEEVFKAFGMSNYLKDVRR